MSQPPPKQIRPKVRRTKQEPGKKVSTPSDDGDDAAVEDTRLRMESWMGLASSIPKESETVASGLGVSNPSAASVLASSGQPSTATTNGPASILKAPKYTQSTDVSPTGTTVSSSSTVTKQQRECPFICKDLVVERDPRIPTRPRKRRPSKFSQEAGATAVEGYVPSAADGQHRPSRVVKIANEATVVTGCGGSVDTAKCSSEETAAPASNPTATTHSMDSDTNQNNDKNDDNSAPLVLHSMEELFQATGQALPDDPNRVTPDAQLVEADLAFSVMTQESYNGKLSELRSEAEQEREAQMAMFLGQDQVLLDENDTDHDDDDDDDDSFLELWMEQEVYSDDEDQRVMEPRAFRKLWDALNEWLTPETVAYVTQLENSLLSSSGDHTTSGQPMLDKCMTPQVDRSDIGASRCAGLMAMIKLYLPSSLNELQQKDEVRRRAENRLGNLLRTLDYSREAPKLQVPFWKAMTCLFLEMVLVETRQTEMTHVPASVQAIGMTLDEYRYLTRSAIQGFSKTM